MTLQAPELVRDVPSGTFRDRSVLYGELLASEWGDLNKSMPLVGYSHSGPLAFEVALCISGGMLNCRSLCMVDPVPYCARAENTGSVLQERAAFYDFAFGTLLLTDACLAQGVSLGDIKYLGDLEHHAFNIATEAHALEIS